MSTAVNSELQAAFDRERRDAERARPRDPVAARTQTIAMYGRLATLQREVIARRGVEMACKAGCNYCCHLRVEIRPYEAFVLAEQVKSRFDAARRARFTARLEANLARVATLSAAEHNAARVACALLEDGLCGAYDGRPAACRKYYSVALSSCEDVYASPSAPRTAPLEDDHVRLAGNAVALGYAKGCDDAGYDATSYELHFALHRALTSPQSERRYRDGKRAFV
jgi:Fe-S-cluster containining protein